MYSNRPEITVSASLPDWIKLSGSPSLYNQDILVNLTEVQFAGASTYTYSGTLTISSNDGQPSESRLFSILFFKCLDTRCSDCSSYDSQNSRGICTACSNGYNVVSSTTCPFCGDNLITDSEICETSAVNSFTDSNCLSGCTSCANGYSTNSSQICLYCGDGTISSSKEYCDTNGDSWCNLGC